MAARGRREDRQGGGKQRGRELKVAEQGLLRGAAG